MEEYSDEALIRQTLNGDKTAFSVLVDRYKEAVHALAYRKLGDFHEAEDVVQETFLRAHQKLSTLMNSEKFAGWLYAIATNCCRMFLRSRERRAAESTPLSGLRHEPISQISPANQLLDDAIEALPGSIRTPLELYYMEGMSCSEIGQAVGASTNAVRDRLYRARKRLREEMIGMKPAKARFEFIGLELHVAGGSNSCRYFQAMGSEPQGALMSSDDARWVIDQFTALTQAKPPIVNVVEAGLHHDITAHPDFIALWEYSIQLAKDAGEKPEETYSVLSTNGYGIARSDDYLPTLKRLKMLGTKGISSALHGLEEHHDCFARREGAFRDTLLSAERAVEAGLEVYFNIWLDRQNIAQLAELLDSVRHLGDRIHSEFATYIGIPRFVVWMNNNLRTYESELRPRLSDLEALPSGVEVGRLKPPYDRYTENFWIERILANPDDPSLMKENFDDASDEESCYILIIDEFFHVYREPYNFGWAPLRLGNLKTDGLPAILDRLEYSKVPELPSLVTLAEKYGDRDSILIHSNAFSVRNKWLDIYWQEK